MGHLIRFPGVRPFYSSYAEVLEARGLRGEKTCGLS